MRGDKPRNTRSIRLNLHIEEIVELDRAAFTLNFKTRNGLLYHIIKEWLDQMAENEQFQRDLKANAEGYDLKRWFRKQRAEWAATPKSDPDWRTKHLTQSREAEGVDRAVLPDTTQHDDPDERFPGHYSDFYKDLDPEDPTA